ncbi:MAG: hypothetical protein LC715_05540, partial [Gammaproteobacteria bacterium]|nr:hypothetical protein [Gammaproteobacteria bacterium]
YMQCVQLAAQALAQNSSTGAVPVTSQGLRRRSAPVRAQDAGASGFQWPAGLAAPRHWAQAFTTEYNQRIDDGVLGQPAPPPDQFNAIEDADARARSRTRSMILEPLARDLQSDSGRQEIQHGLLALATAVAMQVLELASDRLPAMPYAPISTDPSQWPTTPAEIALPGLLPQVSRRIGVFLAWMDAGVGLANADIAQRIAAHRQAWEEMNALVGGAGTLLGIAPGLGEAVAIVQLAVQAVMQSATPDFNRPQTDLAGAMGSIRSGYRAFASALLRGLILARYPGVPKVDMPLQPSLESLIEAHAAHALLGWQEELRFLGIGLDTMAQSLATQRASRAPVTAQELITPYYDPSNPASALTCTNDAFGVQREEWYVGVEDTSAFPHSAICHLRMTAADGRQYTGTGFYVGRTRILTCAHNLHGMSTVQI